MKDIEAIIARCALFAGLDADDIRALAAICDAKKTARGELVVVEGAPARGFFLVARGQVKIFKSSAEGREQILHICGPGESFAEAPVFAAGRYPASACALEASLLLYFPHERFQEIITRRPSLAMNMLANLALKLRRFTMQVGQLTLREVPARLASYLLHLSETQRDPARVTLRIPKGQLANLLGATPETLSRVFARLQDGGVIRMAGREIDILNPSELARLAG